MAPSISASEAAALADKWNAKRDANFVDVLGELNDSTRDRLETSRNNIPTVLYRVFDSKSTGGFPIVNTTNGIIPPAYAHEHLPDKNFKFTMDSFKKLKDRTIQHLQWFLVEDGTEWSSWSASLLLALRYAYLKHAVKGGDAYIAVINTKVLSSGKQRIYHVPALFSALKGEEVDVCSYEYLVLGVVAGAGFYTARFQQLIDNKLFSVDGLGSTLSLEFEKKNDNFATRARIRIFGYKVRREGVDFFVDHEAENKGLVTPSQALKAKSLALAWFRETTGNVDDTLLVMLTVAFLGLQRRFWNDAENPGSKYDQSLILEALRSPPDSYQIPDCLKEDASVMSDIVWVDGYPEIEQTIRMLRALASI